MESGHIYECADFNLRPINIDDSQRYFESMQTDEAKIGFMSVPDSLEAAKREIKEKIDGMKGEKPKNETYAIEVNGEYAGFVEINEMHEEHFEHRANLAYCLHSDFFRRGLATRAVSILTEYIFEKYPHIVRIAGRCRDFNIASAKVMQSAGYAHEGTLMKNKCRDGQYLNDMIFAKVR